MHFPGKKDWRFILLEKVRVVEEADLVVGVVVEGEEAVQVQERTLQKIELGRTKTRPPGRIIIAKEGTIKKWLGLVLVLQLDIYTSNYGTK